jgi:hypothetical protein
MARPIVLVFQELANTSITPVTPDLQTIIVGPAYVINDYPDDAANILLSDAYGTADGAAKTAGSAVAYQPPASGVTTIDVTSYPNNAAGAIVDHDSVQLWLKLPRVIMGSTYLAGGIAPAIGAAITTSNGAPDDLNKITFAIGQDLAATYGIQAGDIIMLTDSAGNTLKRTVLSVGEGGTTVNALRVTQNLPASGWTFDNAGGARIERQLVTQQVSDPSGTILVFPEATSNELLIKGGIQLGVTVAGVTVQRTVAYAQCYLAYRALRQDLQQVDSCNATEIVTKVGKIDARNPLAVGLFCALQNSGSVRINFYGVSSNDALGHAKFRDAVSSRKDLYTIVPLTTDTSTLLAYKIDNETLADPTIASDTGVVQKFRMLLGSGTLPTDSTVAAGSPQATPQQSGASSTKHRTINVLSPGGANLSALVPGDLVTIGLVPSGGTWAGRRGTHYVSHLNTTTQFELVPTNAAWNDAGDDIGLTGGGNPGAEIVVTDASGLAVKYSKLASLSRTVGGSTIVITHRNPVVSGGPYQVEYVAGAALAVTVSGFNITVTFVNATTTFTQVKAAIEAAADANAVVTVSLTGGGDLVTAAALTPLALTGATSAIGTAVNDNYYDILQDDTATFLSSGVLPGDLIEIPANPNDYSNSAFDGAFTSYVVTSVISENRLKLTPASDDTASVATEIPHGYSRSGSGLIDVTTPTAIRYRVQRVLNKDAQVTALIAYAQSFMSKRAALIWPDQCLVAGLVDGSLPRSSPLVAQSAGPQPGYYGACWVGGAMAGLPAQQGLTNLAFAGATSVIHSTDYFTDPQISKLSDGGWLVLQQDNPIAAPYCVHQLTTNPSAVETGEISVVKDLDFISVYLAGILNSFIGRYNVTEDTLSEINRAVVQGMENLKLRKVARIGPPLIEGKVTSLAVSSVSSDRVEIYLDLKIPRPLNRIGLHLVI